MTWILYVCIGASSFGCGSVQRQPFESESQCLTAVRHMQYTQKVIGDRATVVSYCYPDIKESK